MGINPLASNLRSPRDGERGLSRRLVASVALAEAEASPPRDEGGHS